MKRIAIYDMDKTITRSPTWTRFLLHYARHHAPHRLALLPAAAALALGHPMRLIGRGTLKQATHRLLIGTRTPPERIARAAHSFAQRERRDRLFPAALAQIAADRAAGYAIVIATASPRFYADAIGLAVGADAVIATETARDAHGRVLPRLVGANCYGQAKLDRIAAWLAEAGCTRSKTHIRFYSDHISDAPTFAWADEAFVINPGTALAALAARSGWRRLDWSR